LLQNLGRLLVQYHFPEEALQIRELMRPAPPSRAGDVDEPGLNEETAAFAVLGADIESIGTAVLRHWGLDDAVLTIARRLPLGTAVHAPESDDDVLRSVASCANEAVDALDMSTPRMAAAVQRVAQRYGRALGFDARELQQALQRSARGEALGKPADSVAMAATTTATTATTAAAAATTAAAATDTIVASARTKRSEARV
jgi:eukaryotic-like serine/threonine-protein kinase